MEGNGPGESTGMQYSGGMAINPLRNFASLGLVFIFTIPV
jgi:hypothetical protein